MKKALIFCLLFGVICFSARIHACFYGGNPVDDFLHSVAIAVGAADPIRLRGGK